MGGNENLSKGQLELVATFEVEPTVRFTFDPGFATQSWAEGKTALAPDTDMSVFEALVKGVIDAALAFVRAEIPSLEHAELHVVYEKEDTLSGQHEVHVSGPASFSSSEWQSAQQRLEPVAS